MATLTEDLALTESDAAWIIDPGERWLVEGLRLRRIRALRGRS